MRFETTSDNFNADRTPEVRIEDDEIDERPYRITRFCSNCGTVLNREESEDGRCGECNMTDTLTAAQKQVLTSLGPSWTAEKPAVFSDWGVCDRDGNWFPNTTAWNGRTGTDSPTGEVYFYNAEVRFSDVEECVE